MRRTVGSACVVAGAILATSCGSQSDALKQYSTATLVPGESLGDIQLGSPVKPFLERFGSGRVSIVLTDDFLGAELHFPSRGLSFRFLTEPACRNALASGGSASQSLMGIREPKSFLANYPACTSMPLQSIGVDAGGADLRHAAYSGTTAKGTRLGATRDELFANEGAILTANAASTVLESANDSQFEQFTFSSGLVAYVRRDATDAQAPAPGQWKVAKLAVVTAIQ